MPKRPLTFQETTNRMMRAVFPLGLTRTTLPKRGEQPVPGGPPLVGDAAGSGGPPTPDVVVASGHAEDIKKRYFKTDALGRTYLQDAVAGVAPSADNTFVRMAEAHKVQQTRAT